MSWLRYHLFALGAACNHFRRAPGSFLLNILVVAIALALPFAGMTLLENVRPVTAQLAVQPEISIFMRIGASRDQATAIEPAIRQSVKQNGSAASVEFIAREQALDALKRKTGLADALTTLGSNPLPDAYVVKLTGFQVDAEQVEKIAANLKTLPQVDTVQIDSAWVKRLAALLHVLRLLLLFLAVTLGVVVVAVVFNTIRLQVMTQYDEIEVSRLLGATDAFIHRPFYYTGAILGGCAGALALGVVAIGLQPMNLAIGEFARLYGSEFRLAPLQPLAALILLGLSGLLGLLGAMLSVRRQLSRLD